MWTITQAPAPTANQRMRRAGIRRFLDGYAMVIRFTDHMAIPTPPTQSAAYGGWSAVSNCATDRRAPTCLRLAALFLPGLRGCMAFRLTKAVRRSARPIRSDDTWRTMLISAT